ncbi:MAG: manganese efflux pump [Deltaproteobacteria bacterium]|nr:manganese efflux pump [Deltaproteobacteria bacterium]
MDYLTLFGTAWALAMDAFAVAAVVAAGLDRVSFRHIFRLSFHFGLFQAGMPVAGWLGGSVVSSLTAAFAHWIASGLLAFIGVRMIYESGKSDKCKDGYDPTRGWSLVGLSLATSIDALAVGISIGLMGISIWFPAAVIGIVTMMITYLGARIGHRVGNLIGPWAERIGGLVLIAIGIRIIVQH